MSTTTDHRWRLVVLIAVAAIVLGVASTAAFAAVGPHRPYLSTPTACDVPALPGTAVDVTLADMPGAMMGSGMMATVGVAKTVPARWAGHGRACA